MLFRGASILSTQTCTCAGWVLKFLTFQKWTIELKVPFGHESQSSLLLDICCCQLQLIILQENSSSLNSPARLYKGACTWYKQHKSLQPMLAVCGQLTPLLALARTTQ